jgi:hypothetical protein
MSGAAYATAIFNLAKAAPRPNNIPASALVDLPIPRRNAPEASGRIINAIVLRISPDPDQKEVIDDCMVIYSIHSFNNSNQMEVNDE